MRKVRGIHWHYLLLGMFMSSFLRCQAIDGNAVLWLVVVDELQTGFGSNLESSHRPGSRHAEPASLSSLVQFARYRKR